MFSARLHVLFLGLLALVLYGEALPLSHHTTTRTQREEAAAQQRVEGDKAKEFVVGFVQGVQISRAVREQAAELSSTGLVGEGDKEPGSSFTPSLNMANPFAMGKDGNMALTTGKLVGDEVVTVVSEAMRSVLDNDESESESSPAKLTSANLVSLMSKFDEHFVITEQVIDEEVVDILDLNALLELAIEQLGATEEEAIAMRQDLTDLGRELADALTNDIATPAHSESLTSEHSEPLTSSLTSSEHSLTTGPTTEEVPDEVVDPAPSKSELQPSVRSNSPEFTSLAEEKSEGDPPKNLMGGWKPNKHSWLLPTSIMSGMLAGSFGAMLEDKFQNKWGVRIGVGMFVYRHAFIVEAANQLQSKTGTQQGSIRSVFRATEVLADSGTSFHRHIPKSWTFNQPMAKLFLKPIAQAGNTVNMILNPMSLARQLNAKSLFSKEMWYKAHARSVVCVLTYGLASRYIQYQKNGHTLDF